MMVSERESWREGLDKVTKTGNNGASKAQERRSYSKDGEGGGQGGF